MIECLDWLRLFRSSLHDIEKKANNADIDAFCSLRHSEYRALTTPILAL